MSIIACERTIGKGLGCSEDSFRSPSPMLASNLGRVYAIENNAEGLKLFKIDYFDDNPVDIPKQTSFTKSARTNPKHC